MRENATNEVIIVGGGIIGICSALSLIEKGVSVSLIERNAPGQGASFGNAGTISPWSIIPQAVPGLWKKMPNMVLSKHGPAGISPAHAISYLPWLIQFLKLCNTESVRHTASSMYLLCAESIDLYRKHLRGTGHEYLIKDSMYVHVFRNPDEAKVTSLGNAIRAEKGANIERIDGTELRRIEPALSHEFKAGILIHGQARALDPGQIGTVLSEKFQNAGGQIFPASAHQLDLNGKGEWVIQTDNGIHSAQKVVVSAGAWSVDLLRPLGVRVPLAAERGYHLSFNNSDIQLNNSVMDIENHIVANSMLPGLRIAGIADFARPDSPPNARHYETLRRCAKSLIPDLITNDVSEWMGVRPSFPDSLPIIEEVPNQCGLFAAFGHSHYGLIMAPKTGQIVADLVTEALTNQDMPDFSSLRFKSSKPRERLIKSAARCI